MWHIRSNPINVKRLHTQRIYVHLAPQVWVSGSNLFLGHGKTFPEQPGLIQKRTLRLMPHKCPEFHSPKGPNPGNINTRVLLAELHNSGRYTTTFPRFEPVLGQWLRRPHAVALWQPFRPAPAALHLYIRIRINTDAHRIQMAHLQICRYSICSLPFCIRSFSLFTSCCPS